MAQELLTGTTAACGARLRRASRATEDFLTKIKARLARGVGRHFPARLRGLFDPDDIAQHVLTTACEEGLLAQLQRRPRHLAAVLGKMAQRRLVDLVRHHLHAEKARRQRETALDNPGLGEEPGLCTKEPSPIDNVIADELWARLLQITPARRQPILFLLRQGHTHQQAAQVVGLDEKTVRRLLEKLQARLPELTAVLRRLIHPPRMAT